MNGWYKQNRDLFDRGWSNDAKAVSVYVYLHCVAYTTDKKLHGQIIRRGSCLTSRKTIMEETGLSEYDVKSRLKILLEAGEIIVKYSNKGTIITVCDYECCNKPDDLFSLNSSSQLPNELPSQLPNELPTSIIYNKKEDNKNNLRINSKMERERNKALAYEIKEQYNRTFAGRLIEWQRLSEKMIQKVNICILRYGRQSVDLVFDQILHEPFSMGENKTGFQVNFDNIFELDSYEKYLGRYKLRISRKEKPQHQQEPQQQKPSNGSWLDAISEDSNWRPR